MGKFTLTGLVIGQLIGKSINIFTFILGIFIFIACFWIATVLMKEEL
ncbi:MAG: hypothetical protein N3D17_07940 [bacterium]|nr:hypothetical protein [bacterium]